MPPRLFCYRDHAGSWRWRLWVGARIVADSGESYSRRDSLARAVQSLTIRDHFGAARIVWQPVPSRPVRTRRRLDRERGRRRG